MRLIQKHRMPIKPPTKHDLDEIRHKVRDLYEKAYLWHAFPQSDVVDETAKLRVNLKRWINEWDLLRLYPDYAADTEVEVVGTGGYEEQPELEQSEVEEDLGDDAGPAEEVNR